MLRRNLKLRRCKTCKSTSIILSQPPGYITFDCFVCKFVCCLLWQMHIIFLTPLNIKYVSQLDMICFFVSIFERPDEGLVWNVAIKYKFCKSDSMLECVCETLVWGFLFLCFKTVLHACGHVRSRFVFLLCLGGYDCNGDLKPA